MQLVRLIEEVDMISSMGSMERDISKIVMDSRKACENSLFVCIKGAVVDGHTFIKDVVEKGCTTLVVEEEVLVPEGVTVIRVRDSRLALAQISAAYYEHPARKLTTIGVTGTKGKTTTTYMIQSILEKAGIKTGLIGTIETIIDGKQIPSNNTTPESLLLQQYFHEMVQAGCTHVVMEVSSQGLMLHRVAGFTFDYGIFTNLEADHIGPNEHKDFEDYLRCKSMLFKNCKHAIVNHDDIYTEQILQGNACESISSYGFTEGASVRAGEVSLIKKKGYLGVSYPVDGWMVDTIEVNVPGRFSVYNSLAALMVTYQLGIDLHTIKAALEDVKVKGRVEPIPVSKDFTVLIDYAHNAMSLKSLLTTIKEYNPGRLVVIFGCGGNRSRLRRFEMGEVASNYADLTIVTSDNPRNEEPSEIIMDIIDGVVKGPGKYVTIENRKKAIRYGIEHAMPGDILVLAGKGHETYQEVKGNKFDMDERVLIEEVKEELGLNKIKW